MKKIFTFLALLLVVAFSSGASLKAPQRMIPVTDNQSYTEITQPLLASSNLADDDVMMYAYRMYANAGYKHGWYKFPSSAPINMEMITGSTAAGDYGFSAATYAKGKTYVHVFQHYGSDGSAWNDMQVPVGFGIMDHTTGKFEVLYSTNYEDSDFFVLPYGFLIWDMTYDPVTDTIYAFEWNVTADGGFTDISNIYTIDQETCEPTFIGQVNCTLLSLAADNGRLYGLKQVEDEDSGEIFTILVSFDPTTAVDQVFATEDVVKIVNGHTINYSIQAMEFDLTSHRLWWLGFKNDQPFLGELNMTTGRITKEQPIPYGAQHLAFIIPYQSAANAAPARVTNFKVTPGANGISEATLTWNNPTTTYALETLTDLTGVKIYRNDELVATVETTTIGGQATYTDTNVPSGTHTYKAVPYNAAGDGLYREYTEFVGEDLPGFIPVVNFTNTRDEVTLTWDAPTTGLNGGWFDASTLKYNVYRGSKKIASGITETTVTDKVDYYDAHKYSVEPYTKAGEGESTEVIVKFGPSVELPYENELETEERAAEFIAIDANNDGVYWEYASGYQGYLYATTLTENPGDDYLVLPPVYMTAGKKYQLRFYYYTSNYSDDPTVDTEDVEILIGTEAVAESFTTKVTEFNFPADMANGAVWRETHCEYLATTDGIASFALKCTSDKDMGFVVVSHIKIREMSDIEAAALAITGPTETYVNEPANYTVTVYNIGSTDIESAAVKLLDIDGHVLGESKTENLAVGEVRDVVVTWTPENEGNTRIWGSVRVDGDVDKYTWDNVTDESVYVRTNGAGADHWVVIGKDRLDYYDNRVIDLSRKCSRSQWIYFPDEIGSDLKITGLRMHYYPSDDADALTEVPLVVRMTNTTQEGFLASSYELGNVFITEGLTEVFNGVVDFSGTHEDTNVLDIRFDQPFEYDSNFNLLVDFEKNWNKAFGYVRFHFDINPDYAERATEFVYEGLYGTETVYWGRGGFYNWAVPYEDDPWNTATDFFPHIKFSYAGENSIEEVEAKNNLKINVTADAFTFDCDCNLIEVYSIAGAKVAYATNANSVYTGNLPAGVYVVTAVVNGNVATTKVMIK